MDNTKAITIMLVSALVGYLAGVACALLALMAMSGAG